jgi:hypothetical protein
MTYACVRRARRRGGEEGRRNRYCGSPTNNLSTENGKDIKDVQPVR